MLSSQDAEHQKTNIRFSVSEIFVFTAILFESSDFFQLMVLYYDKIKVILNNSLLQKKKGGLKWANWDDFCEANFPGVLIYDHKLDKIND